MSDSRYQASAQQFTRDVAKFQLRLNLDQGIFRDMEFSLGQAGYFQLTTIRDRLVFSGDRGCFVFERPGIEDMFKFFRTHSVTQAPDFNYWYEQLVAVDQRTGVQEQSLERFKENLADNFAGRDDLTDAELAKAKAFADQCIVDFEHYGADYAYTALREFELEDEQGECWSPFGEDYWEYDSLVFTDKYIWACYAIQWGIAQYDKLKLQSEPTIPPQHSEVQVEEETPANAAIILFPELPSYLTVRMIIVSDRVKIEVESTRHKNKKITLPTGYLLDFVRDNPVTVRNEVLAAVVNRYGLKLEPVRYS